MEDSLVISPGITSEFMNRRAVGEARIVPSTQNPPSDGENPGETRLDGPLEDYLFAKSKANETGNYRRNAERVLTKFLDWAAQHDIETFEELGVAALEEYALSLNCHTTRKDGITATTARKYYDYVRAYLSWCASREYTIENPAAKERAKEALPNDDKRDEHHQQLWTPEQRQVIMRYVEKRAHDAVDDRGHDAVKETRDRAFVATIAMPAFVAAKSFAIPMMTDDKVFTGGT